MVTQVKLHHINIKVNLEQRCRLEHTDLKKKFYSVTEISELSGPEKYQL